MWDTIVFVMLFVGIVLLGLYLAMRWGRGARGGSEPENQTATPWKMWPF
jgi:hypothetical protein